MIYDASGRAVGRVAKDAEAMSEPEDPTRLESARRPLHSGYGCWLS